MSTWIEVGACESCRRKDIAVMACDTSGGEYAYDYICSRCIDQRFAAFQQERKTRRAARKPQ